MIKPWLAPALAVLAFVALAGPSAPPAAAMATLTPPKASDDYIAGEKAAKEGRYQDAVDLLSKVVQREPDNADAHNYLGFSLRKLGQFDKAEAQYRVALQLEPDHKAALEYYGELFLQIKNLPRAEEQLAHLARVCPSGCPERDALEQAVKAYKAGS
ncbi:MAG TPA: tetratricopeptide repeat protein [Candidatus Sulfotelmatobacter sp.]|nr:tetratricopeptide repeat protein [Candidatus Sulfotelmatobacter sp.]